MGNQEREYGADNRTLHEVYLGHSAGGFMIKPLAALHDIDAVVFQSPFVHAFANGKHPEEKQGME